ncbi:sugar ABC transporter substrate-binding protein [Chloroflexota bacterium]
MSKQVQNTAKLLIVLVSVAAIVLVGCGAQPTSPAPEEAATDAPAVEEAATEAPAVEEEPTEAPAAEEAATEAPAAEEPAPEMGAELPDGSGLRVAVIWGSLGNDFNVRGHDAAVAALEAMGVEVLDSNAGGDRNRQVEMIENAIQLEVDGMVMGDVAAEIIDPVIEQAREAGIPVVTIGAYSSAADNDVVLNEWVNGWEGALLAEKYLDGKPGNVVIAYEPGFRPIEVRFASYDAAMPWLIPDYNEVAVVNAHWPNTVPEAKAQMEAILRQFPNDEDIDLAFATYDLEAIGMAQAIDEAGRDIPVVGFDASPDMLDWINRGSVVKGTVASDPTGMGTQGAVNLVNLLHGATLPRTSYAPVIPVDLDNLEKYEMGEATAGPAAGGTGEPLDGSGLRVAVIWGSLGNDFNVRGHDAAVAALEEMGVEVLDSNAGGDRNRQVEMIENAIQLEVDGMVMGDVAAEIIDPVIEQAREAGIPVVTVGAYSNAADNDVILNEWLNGWEGALLAQKYLAEKPGNFIVAYEPGFRPIEVRFASYSAAMPWLVPEYGEVAVVNAHWPNTVPEAKAQMEALLRQYPNAEDVDLAFATYDLEAIGMAQAIEEAGRDIPVVGFDASPDMLDWMNRGSVIKGTVASDPTGMGQVAAGNLVRILQGESLPSRTYAPVVSVDIDNVDEYP